MSGSTADERRQCPTRVSGPQPLIVHTIGVDACGERQRRTYHKCFTCAWRGLPAGARLPEELARGTSPSSTPKAPAKPPKPAGKGPARLPAERAKARAV